MATKLEMHSDLLEFLRLLGRHEVRYLVVGGYAVAVHGYVRATNDLDVFVEASQSNAKKLITVFREFGFRSAKIEEALFLTPGTIVRVGVPPIRLEVLNKISGVEFEDCHQHRLEVLIDDTPIQFIGRNELLTNKRASGRTKDLADVEYLMKGNPPSPRRATRKKRKR